MRKILQRSRAVWGNAQAQDIAEYAVMLAVIIVLVIGTVKLIDKKAATQGAPVHSAPASNSQTK